jgi:hypothetical protein
VQTIPVTTTGLPANRNRNPVISGVLVGGAPGVDCSGPSVTSPCPSSARWDPSTELPLVVSIDPASIDTYLDGTGRSVTETVVVFFFTSAGRFTQERGQAPTASTALQFESMPPGATDVLLWAVARDLRGGEAVAGPFVVTIGP